MKESAKVILLVADKVFVSKMNLNGEDIMTNNYFTQEELAICGYLDTIGNKIALNRALTEVRVQYPDWTVTGIRDLYIQWDGQLHHSY